MKVEKEVGQICSTSFLQVSRGAVDSAWEQKKLEATLREMLDVKRAAREANQRPVYCLGNCLGRFVSPRNKCYSSDLSSIGGDFMELQ